MAIKKNPTAWLRKIMRRAGECAAFTLVELMIIVLLIGILVAMSVPVFVSVKGAAERSECWSNQRNIEFALMKWRSDHLDEEFITDSCLPGDGEAYIDINGNIAGDKQRSLAPYFKEGSNAFNCPSNGDGGGKAISKYEYITDGTKVACLTDNKIGLKSDGTPFVHDRIVDVGWSHIRGSEEEPAKKKTPLGDNFSDISVGFIALIQKYYEENGKYPSSADKYIFSDLGLNPDDWQLPVDHIQYTPGGAQLNINPEEGYSFKVTDKNGKTITLSSKEKSTLLYDDKKGKWYYKNTSSKNEIDIGTLEVVKD
jgi:type II secretory pathway pseudopilin PulG